MSTIKDVARYTGLSIATISKYINGGNVLEENRIAIAEAIEKLDYKVNYAARTLKTNRTMTVGALLPSLNTPFFFSICEAIEGVLKEHGYTMLLCSYYDDPAEEREKLRFLVNQGVDGIIMVAQSINAEDMAAISGISRRRTPIVLMDRSVEGFECDRVLSDNPAAVYGAVEHLFNNGHRRVGIIIGPEHITTARERKTGYERVHADYSVPLDPTLIRIGDYTIGSGFSQMNEFMNMENPPSAVLGTNHEMTVGAITAAYERKLKIPEDISFIGFDEVQLTRIYNPPITTVIQPIDEIARLTAEILLRRMKEDYEDYPQIHRLKTRLLLHDSVGRVV